MNGATSWLDLLTHAAPALPAAWLMQLGLALGWALVLATLGAGLARKQPLHVRRSVAAVLGLWALLPGPLTPDFWLGLAFHAPSLTAMLLCGWYLHGWVGMPAATAKPAARSAALATTATQTAGAGVLLLIAVLTGYALLLDTFAVLPLQIYRWGFSTWLLLVLLALGLLPWLLRGKPGGATFPARWLVPASLLLFAVTRLPTGNLWDALLDPLLWLWLQWLLVRNLYRRWRA